MDSGIFASLPQLTGLSAGRTPTDSVRGAEGESILSLLNFQNSAKFSNDVSLLELYCNKKRVHFSDKYMIKLDYDF